MSVNKGLELMAVPYGYGQLLCLSRNTPKDELSDKLVINFKFRNSLFVDDKEFWIENTGQLIVPLMDESTVSFNKKSDVHN